jgi:hypothetical protein
VAGILFALLYGASLILVRLSASFNLEAVMCKLEDASGGANH